MVPLTFSEYLLNNIPSHYMGRWRIIGDGIFKRNGETKHECARFYGTVFDD